MNSRPAALGELIGASLHRVPGPVAEHRNEGRRVLASAREFRHTAQLCSDNNLRLPVISNLHEAARLAVTAVAASKGLRFANRPGAHVAAVDYALAVDLVNRVEWTQLDQLRDLRHKANYPSDLVEPTSAELDQFTNLADSVIVRAQQTIAPIPPPPPRP